MNSDATPPSATPPHPPLPARSLALRVMTMPKDTNQYGTIFGGVILSIIDQAGFVRARQHGAHRWVTVAMDAVEFKQPVMLGDVVNAYATTVKVGRTSVTVQVDVEAERFTTGQTVAVTEARLVMVSVDAQGRSIPFASAPTISE
ncbi:MAG: acyl-CoA thioesterase [Phycisphaerales bacterium]|nr:acyl-CoA thioesterase [Phycisphaerales bacterium]